MAAGKLEALGEGDSSKLNVLQMSLARRGDSHKKLETAISVNLCDMLI